ncbi:MAG TPA: hypothetical protein VJN71_10285, partial [Nitrososphaerales archaeon]|nr:hypothetical protein [Nitrososphaerales archaeon]
MLLKVGHSELKAFSYFVKLVDGALLIVDTQSNSLQLLLFCEGEEAASRTQLISSISGRKDPIILRNLEGLGFVRTDLRATSTYIKILKS